MCWGSVTMALALSMVSIIKTNTCMQIPLGKIHICQAKPLQNNSLQKNLLEYLLSERSVYLEPPEQ